MSPEECKLTTGPTYQLKQDRSQSVSPEEHTLKTMQTDHLKQDRPHHLCHQKSAQQKPGQLTFCRRMATGCVTRNVHINNQANSPPESRQVTVCVRRSIHISSLANSPSETKQATMSPEECTLKTRSIHHLKEDRPHLCHQKNAH